MATPAKSFIATLRVRPDKLDAFVAAQTELKALTQEHEPDAMVYELLQSDEDATLFCCIATFRDEAAFQLHMGMDFHHRLVPIINDCLADEMDLRFFKSLS